MITITADDARRTIEVTAGEEIAATLNENRTAGFQWTVESLTGPLTLVSSEFEPPVDGRPGAGGRRAIVVRAGGAGSGEMRLRYERTWEAGSGDVQRTTFSFVVKSA